MTFSPSWFKKQKVKRNTLKNLGRDSTRKCCENVCQVELVHSKKKKHPKRQKKKKKIGIQTALTPLYPLKIFKKLIFKCLKSIWCAAHLFHFKITLNSTDESQHYHTMWCVCRVLYLFVRISRLLLKRFRVRKKVLVLDTHDACKQQYSITFHKICHICIPRQWLRVFPNFLSFFFLLFFFLLFSFHFYLGTKSSIFCKLLLLSFEYLS